MGKMIKVEPDKEESEELYVDLTEKQTNLEDYSLEQLKLMKGEENSKWKVTDEEFKLIKGLMEEYPDLDYDMASTAFKFAQLHPEQVEKMKNGELKTSDPIKRPKPGTIKGAVEIEGESDEKANAEGGVSWSVDGEKIIGRGNC